MTKSLTVLQKWERRYIPEPNSGCHLWLCYYNEHGYGQTRVGGRKGCNILAHRLAWELFRGPIPDELFVLHRCDNPACVNPDHLYVGTQVDNEADVARRKRWGGPRNLPCGAKHHHATAKLTSEQVRAIRVDLRPQSEIARSYGVAQAAISRLKNGHSYTHIK